MSEQGQWNSHMEFILAMIGSAVGLGNIWRFSYELYSNGGGSFFIPYLVAIAIMGIPFLVLEYGIGFSFKDSFSNILKRINPKFEIIAWILLGFLFVVTIYYVVILGWDLVYLVSSFNFAWGANPAEYFAGTVGGNSILSNAGTFLLPTTVGVVIIWGVTYFILQRPVQDGIGKLSKVLIPALCLIMAFIIVYALTLPGAGVGIGALLAPNWSSLLDVNIWLAAFSQIIFSLSMGQAIALTYASYLPEDSKLIDNIFIVVAANSLFEIFTAFGVYSILGYMSVTSGTPMAQLATGGTGLIFVVVPMVFNIMGPVGRILAPCLFIAILFAGITSSLAFLETVSSSFSSKLGDRKKSAAILCSVGCFFSILLSTGISCYLIAIIDSFVNQFGILILIAVQAIIFGWVYGLDDIITVLNDHSSVEVGKTWSFIIKYLLPVFLVIMWVIGIVDLFSNATRFEISVDLVILVGVLVVSYILTRINPSNE